MYKILGTDQKEYGPVSADQLRQWIAEGRANAQTMVFTEGWTEWKPLSSLPEFSAALTGGRSPAAQANYAPAQRTNGMAITSLIMGILALAMQCCCYGIPFNVLGIIFGLIALSQIKNDPENQTGRGLALTGLILSCVSFALGAILFVVAMAAGGLDSVLRDLKKM